MSFKEQTGYASIDRPWMKFYGDLTFDEKNIPDMSIYQMAKANKTKEVMGKTAIDMRVSANDFNKGVKISYGTLFDRIERSAKSSTALGIKPNQIVPIILPNVPEARILIYADSMIGATSYPISPLLPVNELEKLIYDNDIKNLFIYRDFYQKYARALRSDNLQNIIILDGTESLPNSVQLMMAMKRKLAYKGKDILYSDKRIMLWKDYASFSKGVGSITPYYEKGHIAAIIGTSGTTGSSKGVKLTDVNVNTAAASYMDGKLLEGTNMDALLPSIGYGISMLHYQTVAGTYVYLIPELLTTKFPLALAKLKPDNFAGGPVHYLNLQRSREFCDGKIMRGGNYISGGASLPKVAERALNGVSDDYIEDEVNDNIVVRQGYGLTENVAMGSFAKRGAYKFGSIGIPVPYLTVSVFKPGTDEELKYGEEGEICITGPSVMAGYLNNDAETEKVILIHRDGKRWIHTKDIGYMDSEGRLFLCDRIKNIFMRNGFNVHPLKITEFLNTLEFVNNSYVMGFSHPKEQCVPIAFVEVDKDRLNSQDIREMTEKIKMACYEGLEETSIPYDFIFTDFLPINVGGKIDAKKIAEEADINLNAGPVKKRVMKFSSN